MNKVIASAVVVLRFVGSPSVFRVSFQELAARSAGKRATDNSEDVFSCLSRSLAQF